MTTPANASDLYKNQIRDILFGSNVLTVGDNGRFATIDLALAFLETVTGMIQVAGTTGSITATLNDDELTGVGTNFLNTIQAGDLITTSDDGVSPFITGGIYFPIFGEIISDTALRIATGYAGITGSGKTYEIWRPEKYTVLLLEGVHSITSQVTLPNGINLTITGISKIQSVLLSNVSVSAILYDRAGVISINNVSLARADGANQLMDQSAGVLDTSFINFDLYNVNLADYRLVTGNLFFIHGCLITLSNISGYTYMGLGNFSSDGLYVNNLYFNGGDGSADVCVFTNNGAASAIFANTKEMILDGIAITRKIAPIAGSGALVEIQGLTANRRVEASNFALFDLDQSGAVEPNCLAFSGNGTGVLQLRNSIIQATNSAALQGGITAAFAGDNVYLYGVYGDDGSTVQVDGAATVTTVY